MPTFTLQTLGFVLAIRDSSSVASTLFVAPIRGRESHAASGSPEWLVELIKVSPGLISVLVVAAVLILQREALRDLLKRITKVKALGIEAEIGAAALNKAIDKQQVPVSQGDRKSALRRLDAIASLLRDVPLLWVDDMPESTKNERSLLEAYGVRVTAVKTSAEAVKELRENEYMLVITDLKREGKDREGLDFVKLTLKENLDRWTIAYVGTDQRDRDRPAQLFGITNRPDHLMHLVCDVVERERL